MKIDLASTIARRGTLLRTFSVLSAVILILIALLLVWSLQAGIVGIAFRQETVLAQDEAESLVNAGLIGQNLSHGLTQQTLRRLASFTTIDMRYSRNVRVKIWSPDGTILYSDAPRAIGLHFAPDDGLEEVLDGKVASAADISDLSEPENVTERGLYHDLLEVYVPIRMGQGAKSRIVGAYELYHDLSALDDQEAQLRQTIWLSVGAGSIVLYFSLFFVVRNASRRLIRQSEDNARLLIDAQRREADATLLYQTGERFRRNVHHDGELQQVLDALRATLGYLTCTLLLYHKDDGRLHQHVATAKLDTSTPQIDMLGSGIIGRAAQSRQIVLVPDVTADPTYQRNSAQTAAEVAIPLMTGDELIGVLHVESAHKDAFAERDLRLLTMLADQAAMAIQNASLFAQRDEAYLASLEAMARALDARDRYTAGHSQRVAAYAVQIARRLGKSEEVCRVLQQGGMLHDMGKIGVSDAILKKLGPLTAEETAMMQRHPVIGYDLLRDMPFLGSELGVIRHHHERWDGQGYPDRLAGEQIPLEARILAVADTFDAMTSDRPYRRGMSLATARARLIEGAGSQFWSPAVDACVALLDSGALGPVQDPPRLYVVAPESA